MNNFCEDANLHFIILQMFEIQQQCLKSQTVKMGVLIKMDPQIMKF